MLQDRSGRPAPPVDGEQWLDELYRREVDVVYGFVLIRCGTHSVAEDVTSEVFINAARSHARGEESSVTRPWLLTVASRRLVDHWRIVGRQRARLDRIRSARSVLGADDSDSEGFVLDALDSLPAGQRVALTMRYLDGYSVIEVAGALDISYSAAESLLARARRSFRRTYEELT